MNQQSNRQKLYFINSIFILRNTAGLGINVRSGLTFPGYVLHRFGAGGILPRCGGDYYPIYPSYLIGVGAQIDDIFRVDNAILGFSFDINYGKITSRKVQLSYDNAEFVSTSLPLFLGMTLKTEGTIVIFLKAGFGAERSTIEEMYTKYTELSYSAKDWFAIWGFGGGIDFNYLKVVRISLVIDSIIKEKWFDIRNENGGGFKLGDKIAVVFGGIQLGFRL